MITVLVVAACACLLMIASVLFLPSVKIKGHTLSVYWLPVLIGAVVILCTGALPIKEAMAGLMRSDGVNPFKILILFISMTVMSVYLDEIGFFRYLAKEVLKRAGHSQIRTFIYLYLTVSVLTVFTSNDIVILTFTPFICYFSKHANINPVPYLVSEFVAANTWSMFLLIGNPTNVYLATSVGIGFLSYLKVMWLPALFAGIVAFLLLFVVFFHHLKTPMAPCVEAFSITEKVLFIIGIVHLGGCTILLVICSYIGVEMWLVTLIFALSLFLVTTVYKLFCHKKPTIIAKTLHRAPWELIPFVLSMFILVLGLSYRGVSEKAAAFLSAGRWTSFVFGAASTLSANVINNIPMSVLFCSLISYLPQAEFLPAVYATVIGSNVGAFLTPIGALAGIMWSNILKNNHVRFTFLSFIAYGFLIAIPTLLAALMGLQLSLMI